MSGSEYFIAERRRHSRTHLQMALRCVRLDPDGGDVVDTLHMQNISRSGMGVLCDRTFYPGQRVVLCLPLSKSGGRRSIYASVVHCRQGTEGHSVGIEFDSVPVGAMSSSGAAEAVAA